MATLTEENIFTQGLYTIPQAAHLARITPRRLRRWLDGEGDRRPAIKQSFPENEVEVVGFVDLVQALAIRAILQDRRLTLQKVRETIAEATKLGFPYPFARKHQTFAFHDDVVILIDNDIIVTVTGNYKRQQLFRPIVEVYLDDLTFDPETGLAKAYTPLRDAEREIVISPTLQYGAPVVMPCGYTVAALVGAVESEGSIAAAAEMNEVSDKDVIFALRYEDFLAGIAA